VKKPEAFVGFPTRKTAQLPFLTPVTPEMKEKS
jgi:hypothetical protein